MSRRKSLWLVAASGLLLSCLQAAKSPAQSGEPWLELKSEHFRVLSDVGPGEAARVIAGFEETYTLLGKAIFGDGAVPSFTTDAVVFQHHEDLGQFVAEGFGGVYLPALPNDLEPAPTVITSGTLSPFARLLFAHELTHRFNHVALGPTPTWLNEGLSDYYSTIRGEQGGVVIGEMDPRYMCTPDGLGDMSCYQYERLPGNRLPLASDVTRLDRNDFYGSDSLESGAATWEQKHKRAANYGVAWLLVHMLMTGSQDYAREFQLVMVMPPSPKKGEKLAAIVSNVDSARLDADFKLYLKRGMPWRQHHSPAPPVPGDLQQRQLTDSEVLVLWARLDDFNGKSERRARERLAQARVSVDAKGSGNGAPWFWQARYYQLHGEGDRAKNLYRAAIDIDPDNPQYLYGLLAYYWSPLSGMSQGQAARSVMVGKTIQALTPLANSARQLNAIAAYQLFSNDAQTALATSERACELGPDCWQCFHNRAAVLYATRQYAEALNTQREALNRVPEGTPFDMVEHLSNALRFYESAANDPDAVKDTPRPSLLAP